MTSIGGLLTLLLTLIIVGAVLYVVWWGIQKIPMVEPIRVVVTVVFVLIVVLIALHFLLPMAGLNMGTRL